MSELIQSRASLEADVFVNDLIPKSLVAATLNIGESTRLESDSSTAGRTFSSLLAKIC